MAKWVLIRIFLFDLLALFLLRNVIVVVVVAMVITVVGAIVASLAPSPQTLKKRSRVRLARMSS
ncbi:hypothetical protein N9C01_02045 [bacterium]|nr:hypothetical protein [bacterium]